MTTRSTSSPPSWLKLSAYSGKKMSPLEKRAASIASHYHAAQVRKYTGEPYVTHCREVAALVKSVTHTEAMLCIAWLHDTMEDTGLTATEIAEELGVDVYQGVWMLSDLTPLEAGNRAYRKGLYRNKLALAPTPIKTAKLADLISNARSIFKHDPNFAPVYAAEMADLLEVLRNGDPVLYSQAEAILNDYYSQGAGP